MLVPTWCDARFMFMMNWDTIIFYTFSCFIGHGTRQKLDSGHETRPIVLIWKTTSALPFPTSMLTKRLWHEEKLHSPLEHFGFFFHLNLVASFLRFHILIQIATRTYGHQYTNTFIIIMCNFCFMSYSISLTEKFTIKLIYLLWMMKLIFNLLGFWKPQTCWNDGDMIHTLH